MRRVKKCDKNATRRPSSEFGQMTEALHIRATGVSYARVGKSLNPPVSRQRAWKIVTTAHREAEAAEQKLKIEGLAHFRLLTVYRLERQIRALDAPGADLVRLSVTLKSVAHPFEQ